MPRLLVIAITLVLLAACGPTFEVDHSLCPSDLDPGESVDHLIVWRASLPAAAGQVFGALNFDAADLGQPLPLDDTIRAHVTSGEDTVLDWTLGTDDPDEDLLIDLSSACNGSSPTVHAEVDSGCTVVMGLTIENASDVPLRTQMSARIYANNVPTDGSATIDVILESGDGVQCMM